MGARASKEDDEFLDAMDAVDGEGTHAEVTPGGTRKVPVTKLFQFKGTPGQWVAVDSGIKWKFVEGDSGDGRDGEGEGEGEEEDEEEAVEGQDWHLVIPGWASVYISDQVTFRFNDDKKRVDFHGGSKGPLAIKFGTSAEYHSFAQQYQRCMFENVHGMEYTEANVAKAYGKEFVKGWAKGEDGDEVMWDAEEEFEQKARAKAKAKAQARGGGGGEGDGDESDDDVAPTETYNEAYRGRGRPLGLAMGAGANSYLLHEGGIDVYENTMQGVHSKNLSVNLANTGGLTPNKGLLVRGETNMLLMTPNKSGSPHSSGLRQVDLGAERVVAEWKFEKDGTAIQMRDVTGDSKSAQLNSSQATFLGLDDNRLCRWDMRDRHGIVQQLASPASLAWSEGHQFSRGTNFQCFASTGDGSVAVGSRDGKVRLYSTTSMRQAKTAFPGLGSPITAIDVTYDGRWVLATTDKYLILICTMFRDKDGSEKSAFHKRVGDKLAAPRLLKLLPKHEGVAGNDFKFQNGCFSWVTDEGRSERHIVATVKQYSVVWDFARVRRRERHACYELHSVGLKSCTCYRVAPRDESVVDSKFMHDKYIPHLPATPASPASPAKDASPFKAGVFSPGFLASEAPLVVATPHKIASLQF